MSKFVDKINLIIIPYLRITLLSMLFFDVVYFIFFVMQPPPYRDGDSNFLVPICYGLIIQIIFLRRFISRFNLPSNAFVVNMISYFVLCAQILVSVPLVRQIGNPVIEVANAHEIDTATNHRAFAIKDFDIDKTIIGENPWISRESRKYGKSYSRLNLVLAAPVRAHDNRTNDKFTYWYCRDYSKNMSDTNVAPSDFENFRNKSIEDFIASHTLSKVVYFEKLPEKWINDYQLDAINDIIYDKKVTELVVLEPQFRNRSTDIMRQTGLLIIVIIISMLVWGLNMFKAELKNNNWLISKNKKS